MYFYTEVYPEAQNFRERERKETLEENPDCEPQTNGDREEDAACCKYPFFESGQSDLNQLPREEQQLPALALLHMMMLG